MQADEDEEKRLTRREGKSKEDEDGESISKDAS